MASIPRDTSRLLSRVGLHNGDSMTQKQFHIVYCGMPEDYRAELIGGIVYEPPSPLGYEHGSIDIRLACLLEHYAAKTPGVGSSANATVIMSDEDEVQPDVLLRIEPQFGGQSGNQPAKKINSFYVKGAPELVAEVAHSSFAIDLHKKKQRYLLAGVCEYLVVCLEPAWLYWFDFRNECEIKADKNGISKSKILPGLWIDGKALLELDYDASMKALNKGLRSSGHAKFVARLSETND